VQKTTANNASIKCLGHQFQSQTDLGQTLIYTSFSLALAFSLSSFNSHLHIMELDEFVDMEWLNSHSSTMDVKDESFDSADPFYYMDSTFEPDFMSQDIVNDTSLDALDISTVDDPSVKEEAPATLPTPPSTEDKEAAKPAMPPSFPSTEQIKLLIEAAKKQLALQQQQQEQNGAALTAVPLAQTQTTASSLDNVVDTLPITTVSPDKLLIKQEEEKEPSQEAKPNVTDKVTHFNRASSKMDYDSDEEIHSPEDIKKMTPKERRQLRNKISARNFRVRRKGKSHYIVMIIICGLRFKTISPFFSARPLRIHFYFGSSSSRAQVICRSII
jgi:hypothetical protein